MNMKMGQRLRDLPLPVAGKIAAWAGLPGAVKSLAISDARGLVKNSFLVICVNDIEAEQVYNEIRFFCEDNGDEVCYFPETETLPYDIESPHSGLVSQRAKILMELATSDKQRIMVLSIHALLQRVACKSHWATSYLPFSTDMQFAPDAVIQKLIELGYHQEELEVSAPGQFVLRNTVFDLYPIGSDGAYRLRLDDSVVSKIFSLDVNLQRSKQQVDSFIAQPAREMPIHAEAISLFRQNYRAYFGRSITDEIYLDVSKGILPPGIEAYAPFFQEKTETLFDYLPDGDNTHVFLVGNVLKSAQTYLSQIQARYDDLKSDPARRLLPPELNWLTDQELKQRLGQHAVVMTASSSMKNASIDYGAEQTNFSRRSGIQETIDMLMPFIQKSKKVMFCLRSDVREQEVELLCQIMGLEVKKGIGWAEFYSYDNRLVACARSDIDDGFYLPDERVLVITEKELFGQPIFSKTEDDEENAINYQAIQDLQSLNHGDPIVHAKYGVGRFNGLVTMNTHGIEREYLTILYANDVTTYVKMEDLDLVTRYSGLAVEKAPLDEVSSEKWMKELGLAIDNIKNTAQSLIELKNEKQKRRGTACKKPGYNFYRFCNEFPYQETRDQKAAVDDIIKDMTSIRPMERLVCGDVGFGKTEVLMRACFVAVDSGFQVAVMVPTTLLANQHYESFKKRYASFNFKIECLTRHDKQGEQAILKGLESGQINIVIGTHRLIQSDVRFKNIGLMIIDEEHRFGVNHKDQIKSVRKNVDVLSLTATPIPRTMSMALHGIRDMSIIATPPAKRLSIRTFVRQEDSSVTREAIQRELMRSGQVFYLHNRVESIEAKAEDIRALIPGLRVGVAHGQMHEVELESVMSDFYKHRFDVLVCTTIIETGIDVPRANTILIDDAERLGLAQLHQLRGRVGRSHHQAYAYLFVKQDSTDNAVKRMEAMTKATNLGDGFILANHDLEIRGAGEILGEEQSGQIYKIGFALYMRMLEKAIKMLEAGLSVEDFSDLDDEMNIDIQISGLIDKGYITNEKARLSIYKKFASINDMNGLSRLKSELEDAYGDLPKNAENLLNIARLRCYLKKIDVVKLVAGDDDGTLMLRNKRSSRVDKLIDLVEEYPQIFTLTGPFSIKFVKHTASIKERFAFLLWVVGRLISSNKAERAAS
ncbi:Transcription-repair-coupling factor [compost metagenome]